MHELEIRGYDYEWQFDEKNRESFVVYGAAGGKSSSGGMGNGNRSAHRGTN